LNHHTNQPLLQLDGKRTVVEQLSGDAYIERVRLLESQGVHLERIERGKWNEPEWTITYQVDSSPSSDSIPMEIQDRAAEADTELLELLGEWVPPF